MVVVVCHYVRGEAEWSLSNLVGAVSLAVLYPAWLWIHPVDVISSALYGTWTDWQWEQLTFTFTKHLIPFILGQYSVQLNFTHAFISSVEVVPQFVLR